MVIENVNRGPECLAIFGTGIGVAAMVVILRLWIRVRILRKVGADDWLMAASLVNDTALMFANTTLSSPF